MNKTTIELHRDKGFIPGYGYMFPPYRQDSPSTLEALVEWTHTQSKDVRVYRHVLYEKDENLDIDSNKCERVIYMDIYHQ